MGDYSAPKRRDVVDRLRRRLEHYRQHQLGRQRRFNEGYAGLYDDHRQQAQLLHHRWLESKAKKAKQSKVKQDSSTQGEHRNLVVTKKLKPKLDSASSEQNPAESAYNFDEQDSPVNKPNIGGAPCVDNNQLPQLSVKIVQQINSRPENSQTIHTNVTVSTKTFSSTDSPKPSVSSVHTSVECKQEPTEESQGHPNNQCSEQASEDSIFDVGDELEKIIDTLEGDGEIPADIIKELDKFNEICNSVKVHCESHSDMFGPIQSPGLTKPFPEPGSGVNSMYESNNVPPLRTPSMSSMSDATGPAAETLKQMAAQHQNQSHSPGYPMKSPSIDPYNEQNYQRGNGFVNFQQQGFTAMQQQQQQHGQSQQSGNFPFPPQSHMQDSQSTPPQYPQHLPNKEMLNYGGTKPLTHFSDHGNGQQPQPSSLQQLQNQVRSHFNQSPNPQMQITQTQHMQVSHGQHHMQLSQTQQLQMQQPPQQISLTQQQSFSMTSHPQQSAMASHQPQSTMTPHPAQGQPSQMMNEQMNIQMMEKMREQRQMHIIDQQSQQGQMPPQYMNRPPPEYKVPPVSTPHMHPNASAQYGNSAAGGGPNPLRTMQNMVNQSSYGAVKSEVTSAQTQNGMMQAAHLSAMQSMSSSVSAGGPPQMQRPGQYQGANGQNVPQAATRAQSSSTYTSAIMRNQRPPNVNVGPDGLNISQPRTQEWPRPMMPGARHPGQATMTQAAAMSASQMMQYGHYPNSAAATPPGMMQQPQRPQMNSMPAQSAMMQNNAQAMMQQNVQMAQRVNMRPGAPNSQSTAAYNMSSSVAMAAGNVPPGGVPTSANQGQSGYPATSSAQDDFMMNYLDNAQNTSPDFFDSIVQGSDNFNLLDEILGKQ